MENNNRNDIKEIAKMSNDILWIKNELIKIQENDLHSIYKRLQNIEKRLWMNVGILTVIVALIIYLISQ